MRPLCLFALILAIMPIAYGKDVSALIDCETNPPDFVRLSYEEANSAVNSEADLIVAIKRKKICAEYITNLVNQLRFEKLNSDNKTLAIYLLGILSPSNSDSIDVLIDNIDFKASKVDPITALPRWSLYPAQDALMRIGMSAFSPLLDHIPNEDKSLRRRLLCDVLMHTSGFNGSVFNEAEGRKRLQSELNKRLAKTPDLKKRKNLEAALDEIKN